MTCNLWNLMRPLSAILLMTAFLLLSQCLLTRTIQNLINGTHETEQSGIGRQVASVICQGIIDKVVTKFTIPGPKPGISTLMFPTIVLSLLYSIGQFSSSERGLVFHRKFSIAYLNSVSIYLKNCMLLI